MIQRFDARRDARAARARRGLFLAAAVLGLPSAASCADAPPGSTGPASSFAPAPRSTDWASAVLYFVIVDRFADGDSTNDRNVDSAEKGAFHGGDLKGLLARLDEISDLGVTAIWITPVVKNIPGFVSGAGFPDWAYHGYWADDFTKLDERFGTEDDLRALVDACHQRGIRLLLDTVYNHVGYGSQYLKSPRTRTWLRSGETGDCGTDDLTLCVAGLPDLKTERADVDEFLFHAHLDRAKRLGLDGFRLDTVKHVSHSFWQEHRRRARALLGEGFFLLGEVWGGDAESLDPWFAGDELDAGFDFSFQGNVLAFLEGRGRMVAFDRYLKARERVRPGYLLAQFLSSHDEPMALWLLHGDTSLFRLAAVLEFTTAGIPVIYYGEEVGRLGGDWPLNRSDMPWGDRDIRPGAGLARDDSLRADYVRLVALRRAHPSLWRGRHESVSAERDLLAFARRDSASGDVAIVAVNRGGAPDTLRASTPDAWRGRRVRDGWSGQAFPSAGDRLEIPVPPRGARVLTAEGP
ncbi:MAG TPA: alpha-amylase family glycosyl hydrolase [Candidatus Eisenbacteria bacterium]